MRTKETALSMSPLLPREWPGVVDLGKSTIQGSSSGFSAENFIVKVTPFSRPKGDREECRLLLSHFDVASEAQAPAHSVGQRAVCLESDGGRDSLMPAQSWPMQLRRTSGRFGLSRSGRFPSQQAKPTPSAREGSSVAVFLGQCRSEGSQPRETHISLRRHCPPTCHSGEIPPLLLHIRAERPPVVTLTNKPCNLLAASLLFWNILNLSAQQIPYLRQSLPSDTHRQPLSFAINTVSLKTPSRLTRVTTFPSSYFFSSFTQRPADGKPREGQNYQVK